MELTGLLFDEQSSESIKNAVIQFEKQKDSFDPSAIRKHSEAIQQNYF